MTGTLLPHRLKNPRWCEQCIHPSIGRHNKARWIWRREGQVDSYLCTMHAEETKRE